MSPQAHACFDEKHFEIVGPTGFFKYRQRVQAAVFICLNPVHLKKFPESFIYKRSLVIREAVCCDIFENFCNGGKAKIP